MEDVHSSGHSWGWILTFGCISILAGLIAITYAVAATIFSVIFIAWLLIFTGVLEGAFAIQHRERGHLVWYLLEALLAIVVGALLLQSPVRGAVVLTMLLATYFLIAGMFRIIAAFALRLPNWGWTLANGIISLALGILVWAGWPLTGLWVLGLFIGINLLFAGWARVMLAMLMRSHRAGLLPSRAI